MSYRDDMEMLDLALIGSNKRKIKKVNKNIENLEERVEFLENLIYVMVSKLELNKINGVEISLRDIVDLYE